MVAPARQTSQRERHRPCDCGDTTRQRQCRCLLRMVHGQHRRDGRPTAATQGSGALPSARRPARTSRGVGSTRTSRTWRWSAHRCDLPNGPTR